MCGKQSKRFLYNKTAQPVDQKRCRRAARFQDFLKYANFFYRTIGIRPYEKGMAHTTRTDASFSANLLFYVEIVNMNINLTAQVAFVVAAFMNGNQFIEATYALSYIGFDVVANFKIFFVWLQTSTLRNLVTGMKTIFPERQDLQRKYKLQKYLKQCSFITLSFAGLYMILLWTYNLMAIVKYMIWGRLMGWPCIEQDLPYVTYIPWDWKQHWSYYLIYAAQSLAGYTSAAGQIASDLFLIACTTQLIMHFDYLAGQMAKFSCGHGLRRDIKFLKGSAIYHANLFDLCEQLNQVFGVPLLLNFISSAFVICFVGFQITIGASTGTMIKLLLFFVSSIAQVYLICGFSQQLLNVSSSVANAAYNQQWYLADVRFQKMLILVVGRAQKSAQLKAPAFVHVSFGAMSQLMQISYKFFALLRTMYAKK